MKRAEKIELLKRIAEGTASALDLQSYVFIIEQDGKKYLTDGRQKGREITDQELALITVPKVFIEEEDMQA